jgi:hypothetical protein
MTMEKKCIPGISGDLIYYRFQGLNRFSGVRHGIFTRHGGCSTGPFESLNVGLSVGDEPPHVERNRALIAGAVGAETLFAARQVHGREVAVVERDDVVSADLRQICVPTADALITAVKGVALLIQVADCQPILLYDPVQNVIANVHSGWRGSVQNIVGRTIETMTERFGCLPPDIIAGVGPSLGPCCAEFIHYRREIPQHLWSYKNSRDYFDFRAMTRDQLKNAGVRDDHISIADICTRCRTDLFYSYRKAHTTGRFASVILLTA